MKANEHPTYARRTENRRHRAIIAALLIAVVAGTRAHAQTARLTLTENSGFEQFTDGKPEAWQINDEFSSVSDEKAHTGTHSLKVEDNDPKSGSSVFSERFKVIPRRDYFLRGWLFLESGSETGLGLYVTFRDAAAKEIKNSDGRQQVVSPKLIGGQWVPVFFQPTVPENAVTVEVWVHTFNAAVMTCYVDDLQLLECFEGIWGDAVHWSGGTPEEFMTRGEDVSVRWAHALSPSLAREFDPPSDWSDFSGVSFWLHANRATGNAFMFIVVSENPRTEGMDYWSRKITVDWQGWQQFVFAFSELGRARQPVGWKKVEKVMFSASGWGNTPNPELVIHAAGLRPVNVSQ